MQTIRFRLRHAALGLILTAASTSGLGATSIFTYSGTGLTVNTTGPVNLGMEFTTSTSLTFDALGVYNTGVITAPVPVALYTTSGTLLESATVQTTDPQVSGYFMHSVTPFQLSAGTYIVASFEQTNQWASGTAASLQTASNVTFNQTFYLYNATPAFPTSTFLAAANYFGPTLDIQTASSPVPEPGAWLLLTGGMGLIAGMRRRSRAARR